MKLRMTMLRWFILLRATPLNGFSEGKSNHLAQDQCDPRNHQDVAKSAHVSGIIGFRQRADAMLVFIQRPRRKIVGFQI
jgi:hypothetical protein